MKTLYDLTNHAEARIQQRGIKHQMVNLVFEFGECQPCKGGVYSYFLTRRSIRKARLSVSKKELLMLEKQRGLYLVADDGGVVITAAWRH